MMMDDDVVIERVRVESMEVKENITIQNLRKIFPLKESSRVKVAVDNLCVGIPQGQCFGLLGEGLKIFFF